jgi:GNAT superfamily N-acetyltransferase
MTTPDVARYFAALAATWLPAETMSLPPFTLRRGGGGGNRVSAATLDGTVDDLERAVEAAERAMRAWGQTPLFLVRPGDDALDDLIARRGYLVRDPVRLLRADPATLAPACPHPEVVLGPALLAAMAELWVAGGIGPTRLAIMERVPEPKVYLIGRSQDRPAGCGFAARHEDIVMLHALEVAPFARHRGVGSAITRAAAGWTHEIGASDFALAVTESNAPGRALYASLGMAEVARYHYRIAPADAVA